MKSSIVLPDRIAFVNMRDGKVFYDCHPAEARTAIETIEEMRSKHGTNPEDVRLTKEIESVIDCALGCTSHEGNRHLCTTFLTPHLLSDMFSIIEKSSNSVVTHIVMDPVRFGDIRKWSKDCAEFETKDWKLRLGFMATAWGAKIVVSTKMTHNRVVPMSADFEKDGSFKGSFSSVFEFSDELQEPVKSVSDTTLALLLEKISKIEETLKSKSIGAKRSKKKV